MRLAVSGRHVLNFASNRVRFTIEMQLAVRMKLMLPLLLFGVAAKWCGWSRILCMSTPVKRPFWGADTRFFIEEGLDAYRKPADPQAAHCPGEA
ncbi:hypothetical protein DKP76_08220 [Falsochrobactrum shanghaiense]|uniref:Uncharacterized protein n=1 Tax=Falsochrobactrum shanghaiense TaxID=2201899 RepID=A0A316JAQ7_9HYPH|nr:hypothetical protein DKP76_08220 [Falsochrobactrum shanghaiense]